MDDKGADQDSEANFIKLQLGDKETQVSIEVYNTGLGSEWQRMYNLSRDFHLHLSQVCTKILRRIDPEAESIEDLPQSMDPTNLVKGLHSSMTRADDIQWANKVIDNFLIVPLKLF